MRAIISAVSHFAPEKKLTNADLAKLVDTSDEWIVARTGIKERVVLSKDKPTSYMAAKAAKSLLEQRKIDPDELDLIIVATVTPDMFFPSTACIVQHEINATNCWGYDLLVGCAGFIFALITAKQFIETGQYKKVMVIGADKMSSITNYKDRNTCILFGDAAGAVLLEPSNDNNVGIMDYIFKSDGSGKDFLRMPGGGSLCPATPESVAKDMHYLQQDGKVVFKKAILGMADTTKKIMEKNGLSKEDIKFYIPHQANIRIIESVAKRLGLKKEQVVVNIENYGNTTAATIPMALSEIYQAGLLNKGDNIIFSAFGTGFSWGSALLTWAME